MCFLAPWFHDDIIEKPMTTGTNEMSLSLLYSMRLQSLKLCLQSFLEVHCVSVCKVYFYRNHLTSAWSQ